MIQYSFQRGETISLALDALTGDPSAVTGIHAVIKPVAPGRSNAAPGAPAAAIFTAALRAADRDNPAGWTLTIPADISAQLLAGRYITDARLSMDDGTVVISDSIIVHLHPSVSA